METNDPNALVKTKADAINQDATLKKIIDEWKGLVRNPPAVQDDKLSQQMQAQAKVDAIDLLGAYIDTLSDPNTLDKAKKKHAVMEILQERIKELDEQLSAQVSAIMHDEKFQKLEASWRGLRYLVFNTETSTRLKLRLFCVTKENLAKDLAQAIDKDQSALFKKVYEEEYGTYGGSPFSLLIGDYQFGRTDVELLRNLSGVAASAHTPFISSAAPDLFGMESFTALGVPRDISKIFETADLTKWRNFRTNDDARYITLTLPRFLLRLPYGKDLIKAESFGMEEDVDNPPLDPAAVVEAQKAASNGDANGGEKKKPAAKPKKHESYLWGNSAYALGARITDAFAKYGWCAAIRGPEGGGKVTNLPLHVFDTQEGDKAVKIPTEVAITDRREKELDGLGFVPLVYCKNQDYAAFFGGQTTHKPPLFDLDAANANAALSARLPYLLAASRFAHYLKVMCRDKVGTFQTKETMSQFLNRWIMTYVLATDDAGQDVKAQFPLREARVDVFDVPGKPGTFRAVCFLRPHFQLEELTTSIRLVAELPPPVAAS